MGLDTTHDAYHGHYGGFTNMRSELMKAYNGTNLREYYGYGSGNTLLLENIYDDGLRLLFAHSDCDGELTPAECKLIANSINKYIDKCEVYKDRLEQFRDGCLLAYKNNETLEFG